MSSERSHAGQIIDLTIYTCGLLVFNVISADSNWLVHIISEDGLVVVNETSSVDNAVHTIFGKAQSILGQESINRTLIIQYNPQGE